jgi:RHS repeat-associated protein
MLKIFIRSFFLLVALKSAYVHAQSPTAPPAPYTDPNKTNYVRTWNASLPVQDPNVLLASPVKEVKQATQYHDGLGRPLQTVAKKASLITDATTPSSAANAVDLVTAVLYDEFGREKYNYLPFGANSTGGNSSISDGAFKLNPFQQQATFSTTQHAGETWFYGETRYEPSVLNRITKTLAPGDSWIKSERGVAVSYEMNAANEVIVWNIAATGIVIPTTGSGGTYYPAGELTRSSTADESSKRSIEYKDKNGLVILKKVEIAHNSVPAVTSHSGWLCTYYVYDVFNNLRFVIPPKAVEAISSSWSLGTDFSTSAIAKELCFAYEYDDRNRLIIKKVPGAGEVHMVYDARDRLVLTQDANQRPAKWSYLQYDELNRTIATGIWANNQSRATHAAAAAASTAYPQMSPGDVDELTRTFYDDYSWRASWGNPLVGSYSTEHDTYLLAQDNGNWPYPQKPTNHSLATRGLVTGTRVKLLNTSTYLFSVNFYDDKGRLIQVHSKNAADGHDVVTTQYNWSGLPLRVVQKQQTISAPQTHIIVTKYEYDELGRQIAIRQSVNSTIGSVQVSKPEQAIAQYEYDALGQMKTKKLGVKPGTSDPLETLSYDYNIRGWMLGANKNYIKESGESGYQQHWFGFELNYDKDGYTSTLNKQYNANIGSTIWKSRGDERQRKIDFYYDAANRLLRGDYVQKNGTAWNVTEGYDFSVKMGDGADPASAYDANGNIIAMQQTGYKLTGTSSPIDNMQYGYYPSSNKLQVVTDAANDEQTKRGDFHYIAATKTATDFDYDANGNLLFDRNKSITSITYNYLNLPEAITLTKNAQQQQVKYYYDASGNKYKKEVLEPSLSLQTSTLYIGNGVYKAGTGSSSSAPELQFFQHAEGRLRFEAVIQNNVITGGSYHYDYFIKDHLGNVRMVLTEQQQQDVYPAATLEGNLNTSTDAAYIEKQYYNIDAAHVAAVSEATGITTYQNNNGNPPYNNNPNSNTTANSQKLYKLEATSAGGVSGLGITLKVMSGDRIDIFGKSYYFENNTNQLNYNVPVLDVLTGLLGSPSGAAVGKGATASGLNNVSVISSGVGGFLTDANRGSGTVPKAYINWILFDENFHYVDGKFSRVGSANTVKDHGNEAVLQNIPVGKSGYLYVYCSNESPVRVFFDNLQVVHTRGALLEENHYYAFGLEMAGLSSKSFGKAKNKYKYGGKELNSEEFSAGDGLEIYDFHARFYDAQTGRFQSMDPLADEFHEWNPYTYSYNNPVRFGDPTGMSGTDWVGKNNANGSTTWHWEDNITSAAQAKAAGYDCFKAAGTKLENARIGDGHAGTVYFGTKAEGIGYDESNYPNWAAVHESKYDSRVEGYRAWQSHTGYHKGESKFERIVRMVAYGSMEARRDFASGGMNMYGGYGRLAKAATSSDDALNTIINISDDAFVHVTTPKGAERILANGLNPEISGFVTKWKYIKDVTNSSDFNTILYSQKLWPHMAGKFDQGVRILQINAKAKLFSPRTNWVNGVPQYKVSTKVLPENIISIR